jgi:hypothetical protein
MTNIHSSSRSSSFFSAKTLILTHNAMTGNHQCDWIRRTRPADSPHGTRFSKRFCDVAVGNCLTVRNRTQLFPNLTLKSGRPDVERQIEPRLFVR